MSILLYYSQKVCTILWYIAELLEHDVYIVPTRSTFKSCTIYMYMCVILVIVNPTGEHVWSGAQW